MTASTLPRPSAAERRAGVVDSHQGLAKEYVLVAFTAVVAALPLGLAVAPAPYNIAGIVYAILWIAIVLPSTGAYTTLIWDATLIILDRPPLFLPTIFAAYLRAPRDRRRAMLPVVWLALAARWVNPLANVATAALVSATRLRPQRVRGVLEQAQRLAKGFDHMHTVPREPIAEMSRPAIHQVEREMGVEMQPC
jgi:hypothetical protein